MDPFSTFSSIHLVVDDRSVNIVDFVQFTQLETTGRFDEYRFGSLGFFVTKGCHHYGREMNELSVDLKDERGGCELGFETMGRCSEGHQCLGQL